MPITPSRPGPAPRCAHGFTLIGIMVAIAIVGVLFSLALPAYQSKVLKTKRYAAQSCLMEYAQYMERWYTTNTSNPMSFTGATLQASTCKTSLDPDYDIALTNLNATTYTLSATAKSGQARDTGCTALTLAQDASRSPATCWP